MDYSYFCPSQAVARIKLVRQSRSYFKNGLSMQIYTYSATGVPHTEHQQSIPGETPISLKAFLESYRPAFQLSFVSTNQNFVPIVSL